MRHQFTPEWINKFWSRVDKAPGHGPHGDCWLWMMGGTTAGYGVTWLPVEQPNTRSKSMYAHRVAFLITHGHIPVDRPLILHRCDTRRCCNPDHLFPGTDADNVHDMWSKGRAVADPSAAIRVAAEVNRRITRAMIAEIRHLAATTGLTQRSIAQRFGVSGSCVSAIVRRAGSYSD
jgi:predicted XRE-type DNA-binding protein